MAQSPPGESDSTATTCTDLSGKIPLPCPGQKNIAPARPATAHAPAPVPDSDVQAVSAPSAQASQRDASPATGLHPVSATKPPPVSVEPPRAEPPPSASSSASAAVALTPGCTDLSGRHAVPCPAKTYAAVSAAATRGPDAGSGAAPSGVASSAALAPEPVSPPAGPSVHSPERALLRNLFADQKAIWGSPLRIRLDNVQWLVPLLGGAAVMIASDTDIQNHIPTSPSFRRNSNNFSNYGVAGFAGITGATWLWGLATHNDKMRETGVLSGEAALDSFALTYAIKSITQRDRPYEGNGHGNFWSKGDSFPSEHAVAAWSVATVFAHEYPGPLTKLFAYGGAAAISAARVAADKHFASDALVGSAIGYFIGRQVYKAHHDQGTSDAAYGTFERARGAEGPRDPANMGSTYVALDSWVYDAMDRLAALGYIRSAFAGLRPWSRMECARLLEEAATRIQSDNGSGANEGVRLFRALQAEFLVESGRLSGDRNIGAELESIYTRFTGISGKPLNDSYHFGQTIINDYGRPYQEGFNMVTGFTSHAEAGPLAFYVRGEYQHSPSAPAYPLAIRQAIAATDGNPVQPAIPFAAHDDFQLLDTYAALNIKDNQISFGRQSTWWGPGHGGALMFSDNALPMYMLRWTRVSPTKLPSFLGILGLMRTDMFVGRLEGHHFPGNPYISTQKISFKPTENLELGFSKMSVFAGGGTPLTWHNYYKATFSVNDRGQNTNLPGIDPGDRRGGFDFTYRVPGLRKWLTLYSDSLVDDDPSPLASPRRAAFNPGIYLSHVPGLPHLDFRAESAYTDLVAGGSAHGNFIYWNGQFRDSHTNNGNIMGSWVGRQGRGIQVSSTYWFSPQNTINFSYRNGHVARDFLEGGDLNDISGRASIQIGPQTNVTGLVQYEWWNFPLLSSAQQRNVSASIQITYRPARRH